MTWEWPLEEVLEVLEELCHGGLVDLGYHFGRCAYMDRLI